MDSKTLKETTVAITGAAGGLGKAIATAFLEAGSNVAICDIQEERLSQAENGWKQYGDRFLISKTDITDEAAVESFVKAAVTKFGRLDMVVNNAGIVDTCDPVGSTTKASWDRVIGLNLTGQFVVTKAAVNAMEAAGSGGTIVSIGSNASVRGLQAGAAYTASKHGLLGLVRNTAGFYGAEGIYSVALLLGGMEDTNITDSFRSAGINQEAMGRVHQANPGYVQGKTCLDLSDVAKYCLFLADRAVAAASNGSAINVNKNWPYA